MAFWAREKLLPHIGVRRVESSQESARDPGLSVAGAAGDRDDGDERREPRSLLPLPQPATREQQCSFEVDDDCEAGLE